VFILTKWKETEIGKIPEDWEIINLEQASELLTDGSHFSPKEDPKGDCFIATVKDMGEFEFDLVACKRISRTVFDKLAKANCKPEKGDVLFSKDGTMGLCFVYSQDVPLVLLSSIAIIRPTKEFDSYFLKYHLSNPKVLDLIISGHSSGSALPRLTLTNLKGIPILKPPLAEQRAIAKILSDLDSKIELNQQMNKTLEDIAQAIFKRWFIDFEFPNEKGEPYKSSGGEMVESELGMIPKGWEVKFIEDLFIFKKGEEVGSKNYSDSQNSDFIQFYRVHDISSYGNQSKTYVDKKLIKTGFFKNDDILVSLDGTIGRVYFGGNGAYSSGIRKIESKYSFLGKGAILSLLKSELFQNELILYSADATTIKHASAAIKNIKIVYNKNILERYSKVTEPIFNMMLNNVNNNSSLINIRDFLLPKLMTSKIRVPIKGFT